MKLVIKALTVVFLGLSLSACAPDLSKQDIEVQDFGPETYQPSAGGSPYLAADAEVPEQTPLICEAGETFTLWGGCLEKCGVSMVIFNGECKSENGAITLEHGGTCFPNFINGKLECTGNPENQYAQNVCNPLECTGAPGIQCTPALACPAGQVKTPNGCLPQGQCAPCYGQSGTICHASVDANKFYGGED